MKSAIHATLLMLALLSIPSYGLKAQDAIMTADGTLKIHPVFHGTLALEWGDKTIYVDPYGGAEGFEGMAPPDLVIITHAHGDHLDAKTLSALDLIGTTLVAPASVVEKLGEISFADTIILANDESTSWEGIRITAVPMYNLPDDETSRHPKGWGNGYLIDLADLRVYISGDTEDIPEMRALQGVDVAFVCMNLPYTMDVNQAADAVLDFKPTIVYPYHYRGRPDFSDTEAFHDKVRDGNPEIEVRLRNWYKD